MPTPASAATISATATVTRTRCEPPVASIGPLGYFPVAPATFASLVIAALWLQVPIARPLWIDPLAVVLVTLPWPQWLFSALSLATAGAFAALARRSALRGP